MKEKVEEASNTKATHQDTIKVAVPNVAPLRIKFNVLSTFFYRMSQVRGKKKTELLHILAEYFFKAPRNPVHTYTIIRLIIPF